ncbi:MAG TPA: PHB depolymerase family esterase [Kofleriaceae bacterium]|nr:PHB depolymerase family esterase [Kofleriaceae bacterium]
MIPIRLLALVLAGCATSWGHNENDVVFTRYSALASNAEIARRSLPPLTYRRVEQALAARHEQLADQAIDLANERFDLYVPGGPMPPDGYGVLVFVAPWDTPTRPDVWRGPLDRHHLIFVSAERSGNEASVLDRRLPLALLAYENVRARFHVDPRRVFVYGLSGGSRVAERAAMAYPDVFHGAVLDAGSDRIDGRDGIYKPPAELFRLFQHTRLVYITGDQDLDNLDADTASIRSMRDACVLDVDVEYATGLAHQALDIASLDKALDALDAPHGVDPAALARCDAGVERDLAARLAEAEATVARGDRDRARTQLLSIEAEFGGLAAAQLRELDAKIR